MLIPVRIYSRKKNLVLRDGSVLANAKKTNESQRILIYSAGKESKILLYRVLVFHKLRLLKK